jgi:very-short-patch-repair endonuclease
MNKSMAVERFPLLCELAGLPAPGDEFRFDEVRRWRFDYAWVEHKIAVEIEGGTFRQGRHNRPVGYAKDCEKYNEAQYQGWRVFRFTSEQVLNGFCSDFLETRIKVLLGKKEA